MRQIQKCVIDPYCHVADTERCHIGRQFDPIFFFRFNRGGTGCSGIRRYIRQVDMNACRQFIFFFRTVFVFFFGCGLLLFR